MCSFDYTLSFYRNYNRRAMPYLVLFAVFLFHPAAQAQYGGGSGTQDDPYLIRTAEQMNAIDLSEEDWDNDITRRF